MQSRQAEELSAAQLRLFVAILVQNETIFSQYRGQLTVAHFEDESYQLLYRLVLDHYADYETIPSYAEITSGLESYLELDPEVISEHGREDLEDFLAYAFDPELFSDYPPTSSHRENFAHNTVKLLFLRHEQRNLERIFRTKTSLDQLPFLVRTAQTQMELIALTGQNIGVDLAFEPGWDTRTARMTRSTGLGFLDKYLGGGTSSGEVYAVLAPFGTCKTTLAAMLWCTAAQQCYEETVYEEWDQRKGLAVLVTYEAPKPEIQRRSLMYAASVRRDRLDQMSNVGLAMLGSDPEKPQPYETSRFEAEIQAGVFKPEQQRIQDTIQWLNSHALCLDFSGADKRFPTAGNGGIVEIVQRVEQQLREREGEYYVKTVIIDYLGLLVDRDSTTVNDRNRMEEHKSYQKAIEQISKRISKHFSCHTWVFHQLSGSANSMLSPTKLLHHTDAKGSKSFAENLDFAFVFGNLNNDSMGQVACTKHRHYRKLPPTVIQVDGEFNLVRSPDNFHIDAEGKIVSRDTMQLAGSSSESEDFNDLPSSPGSEGPAEISDEEDPDVAASDDAESWVDNLNIT
jgi:hypothetical protein